MGGFVGDAFDFIGDFAGGLGKSIQGAFSGDLGSLLNIASIIPSPIQPFAMGANAINRAANDDPLGAAFSAFGAGSTSGLFSNPAITAGANASANIGGNALSSFDGLSAAAPSFGDAGIGGVSSMFQGGGNALGDIAGLAGSFEGMNPGITASAIPSMGSAIGDIGGMSGNFSPMTTGLATDAAGGSDMNFLQQLFGTGGDFNSMYNSPGANILGAGSRMLGGYLDYQSQKSMQDAYRNNISSLQQLYGPDSPYAQQMRNTLSRRDAARGRNSQYGAREQALAANLTQNQAGVLSSPAYMQMLGASNAQLNPWGSILGNAPRLLNGLGSLF